MIELQSHPDRLVKGGSAIGFRRPSSSALSGTILSFLLLLITFSLAAGTAMASSRLQDFTSDGCSLFPDGTLKDRNQWCDCCLQHDIAYWRGGTDAERLKADEDLRACVVARTKDLPLAETMFLGVRAGGHPAFLTWYRWGYGWPYGRGYAPLTDIEKRQAEKRLARYYRKHPAGFCGEKSYGHQTGSRPPAWAAPVPSRHMKNFFRLDDRVFRSAQPTGEGFRELENLGVRNVLSLRNFHADKGAGGSHLNVFRVRMEAEKITDRQVIEALRIIRNTEGPILIHCLHGSDRTGLISALYRILFQGWPREDAIDELIRGGYGYHALYKNIPDYIRTVDLEKIRGAVFLP